MNVSIVIPAYNAALTLEQSLQSVLAQSSANWEVVVVDDGSTDSTAEIARNFARMDERIHLVRRLNGGEATARNTGLEHVQYDWILFLDSDDWIAPDHLQHLTAELEARPELDAVVGKALRVASDGTFVSDDYDPPEGDLFPTLACRAAFPVHACIVRRALIESVGKFDTSFHTSTDWDLWQRIARTGARFGVVHQVVAYYRMSPASASTNAELMFVNGLRILQQGRAPDPRVPRPDPAYLNGISVPSVEQQVFYLLTWCAGLVLASGTDARGLLDRARDYHWPELYPPAIARCLFDAGILSKRQAGSIWESLLPGIIPHIQDYLVALEKQSGTVNLTTSAMHELKCMILKNSPVWGSVIARQEHLTVCAEELKAKISSLSSQLECSRLSHKRMFTQQIALNVQLRGTERLAEARSLRLGRLRERRWIRLGLMLRTLDAADLHDEGSDYRVPSTIDPAALELSVDETITEEYPWRLRVAPGNIASLVFAAGNHDTVRVDIRQAGTMAEWDIQLEFTATAVQAASVYRLRLRARADKSRTIGVGLAQAHEPWANLGFYRKLALTKEWQPFVAEFAASADDDHVRVHFDCGNNDDGIELAGVQLQAVNDRQSTGDTTANVSQ